MAGDSGTPAVVGDGRRLGGRYRLLTVLGRGGAGVVWAAEDELLRRRVAVKEVMLQAVLPEVEQAILRERVLREARAAARVHDPGLVTVSDVVEEEGRPWIVMELVDAESLADAVRTRGPLPVPEVAEIGIAVAYALGAAHRAGVLHRDVKPGNVLLGRDGRVRLTDFGIASTAGDPTLTQTGMLLGSPSYIPPESGPAASPRAPPATCGASAPPSTPPWRACRRTRRTTP